MVQSALSLTPRLEVVVAGGAEEQPGAASGAIVVAELPRLAGLCGGAVPPAAIVPVLDPGRATAPALQSALLESPGIVWPLVRPLDPLAVRAALRHAAHWAALAARVRIQQEDFGVSLRFGLASSAERDMDRLMALILSRCRASVGAEAGSLFLVEGDPGARKLARRLMQNDVADVADREARYPVDRSSLAGYAASTGSILRVDDVESLPAGAPFRFHPAVDQQPGHPARTALAVPLILGGPRGDDVIGVVELLNPRSLSGGPAFFDARDETQVRLLALQAAAALDNARRHAEGCSLVEGLIGAAAAAIESRYPPAEGHAARVAALCAALAEAVDQVETGPLAALRFNGDELRALHYAALLHDAGTIGIRDEILLKPARLSAQELRETEAHVERGLRLLRAIPWGRELRQVPAIVAAHHERLDGSGYPKGLSAPAIPPAARILSICDIFDALVAGERPYLSPVSVERALAVLDEESRAGRLDGDLFRVFVKARVFEKRAAAGHKPRGAAARQG